MIVIETCPKCGADLIHLQICTNPPIPRVECPQCGWYHEEKTQEVVRIPYGVHLVDINSYQSTECHNYSCNARTSIYPTSCTRCDTLDCQNRKSSVIF